MRRWLWLGIWASIAGLGLARSFLTSLDPPHSTDLKYVVIWADQWLWSSTSAYTDVWPHSNYPPHALVFISPLTLVRFPRLPLVGKREKT